MSNYDSRRAIAVKDWLVLTKQQKLYDFFNNLGRPMVTQAMANSRLIQESASHNWDQHTIATAQDILKLLYENETSDHNMIR